MQQVGQMTAPDMSEHQPTASHNGMEALMTPLRESYAQNPQASMTPAWLAGRPRLRNWS